MAGIVTINKHLQYQDGVAIYFIYAGEHRSYDVIKKHFPSYLIDEYVKDGTFVITEQVESEVQQEEVKHEEQRSEEDITVEPVYKVMEGITSKKGITVEANEILTEKELKNKGFGKTQHAKLQKEEKLITLNIVKWFQVSQILNN